MKLLKVLACLHVCLFTYSVYGQSGRIIGSVADLHSKKPIEYASVSVSMKGKVLNGVVTNKKGEFVLKGLTPGVYNVSAVFVGYDNYTKDSIVVNGDVTDLHTLLLAPSAASLQSVTVTSKTPLIENKIDKIVYNAANDITSQGGLALDVLKKVPQVTVDIDGNVELQGNPNIRFLINGKPSAVFGNSLADALAAIPASQIKAIEAITSPGAKYSAQGTGGIINIILEDNKVKGINGIINGSAGTRLENAALNLSYKNNNFGMGVSLSGNEQLVSRTPFQQQRRSFGDQKAVYFTQNGYTDFERYGRQAGMSFEWNPSKNTTLNGSVTLFRFGNRNRSMIEQMQSTYDSINKTTVITEGIRSADSRSKTESMDWNLAYTRKFKKEGEELSIVWEASAEKPFSYFTQQQQYKTQSSPYSGRQSNNPGRERDDEISIDYVLPLGEEAVLETGVRGEFADIHSSADVSVLNAGSSYVHDSKQSYTIAYKRQVYGAYVSADFSLFHQFLAVKAGMRFEQAYTQIDFPNANIPANGMWIPSLVISHKFNDRQSVKIAFTKRLERPELGDVNPFINLSDPYNISTGNPLLKPEIGHNTELGYSYNFPAGGNIYVALFERINTQDIKMVTTFYPTYKVGDSVYNNVAYSLRSNFGTEYNTGANISASAPVTKKWNLRTNISYTYRQNIVKNGNGGGAGGRIRMNLNSTYQFGKDLITEAFVNYLSAFANIQGRSPQQLTYTFAARKQFMQKKMSVGITATNPFTRYVKQQTTTETFNSYSSITRSIPYRSFGISFSWKFGKLEFKKQKEEDNGYQKELPQQ